MFKKQKTILGLGIEFAILLSFSYIVLDLVKIQYLLAIVPLSADMLHSLLGIKLQISHEHLSNFYGLFGRSALALAVILLFARSIKAVVLSLLVVVSTHFVTITLTLTDMVFYALGAKIASAMTIEVVSFFQLLLFVYLPKFLPLTIGYALWKAGEFELVKSKNYLSAPKILEVLTVPEIKKKA